MTISYPVSFPTIRVPKDFSMDMINQVGSTKSPTTGQSRYQKHSGQWWEATITLPILNREQASEFQAFLGSLMGRYGTFLMGDPDATTPRGIATGTPLVKGASQTGNALITDGWTISTTGMLLAGDYIQIGNHMYMVLVDANSDGAGDMTLDVWPNLRADVTDNAAITTTAAKGIWRLATNTTHWSTDSNGYYTVNFSIKEGVND